MVVRACRGGRRAPGAPRSRSRRSPRRSRQARPNVSVTTTASRRAEPFRERRSEALGRRVRVLGQQGQEARLHVRGVDAGVRAHEPVARLARSRGRRDARRRAASRARPMPRDRRPRGRRGPRPSRRPSASPPRRRRRGRRAARAARRGAPRGRRPGGPRARPRRDGPRRAPAHATRSSAKRASASARASSVMIVSVTAHADARRRDPVRERAVDLVDHPRAEQPAVGLGGARRGDLDPGDRHQLVGHPGERRAADDRRSRRPRPTRRRGDRLADPRDREDRADRGDRVRRADDHDVGVRDRLEHARRRARRVRRPRTGPPSPRRERRAGPSTPGSAGRARAPSATTSIRVVTGSSLIGRSRAATPNRAAIRAVTSVERRAGREPVRAEQVGREVEVAEVEPGHVGVEGRSSSVARKVSSRRPHPRSRSNASPSQYVTESRSGETWSPCICDVVAGVHDRP